MSKDTTRNIAIALLFHASNLDKRGDAHGRDCAIRDALTYLSNVYTVRGARTVATRMEPTLRTVIADVAF